MTKVISMGPSEDSLADFLARGRKQARLLNKPILISQSLPLDDGINFSALFTACKQTVGDRTFWSRPDKDFWLIGKGNATKLTYNGSGSMNEMADEHHSLLQSAQIEAPGIPGVGPVALVGFRYDTETPRDSDWQDFPDTMLVIPRFLFSRSGKSMWLTINTMAEPEIDTTIQAKRLISELQTLDTDPLTKDEQPLIKCINQDSVEQFTEYVQSALEEIEQGLLTKVVAARRKILYAERPFSLDNALRNLCQRYPDCTVFAIENGESSFFGATPESLAHVNEAKLSLTCLAGSTARGSNREEDYKLERQLFESPKERLEHTSVVAPVTESLKDLCRDLQWDREIQVLKLRNVQHLLTSVTGSLHSGNSILDVVKRLHPTPAVAGVPTDRAMDFIRKNEGDRGWYASPVGWLDHTKEGEFAVGIRSGLLFGKQAILYAGAGIVKGSDPEDEFRETELKFQPIMTALGVSE
jgi:menaquinone-specific isochorismate synthase